MPLDGVLFIPYRDTLNLLSVEEALQVCEDVYRMHARGTVQWSNPPSWKLDAGEPWHNHWHVKGGASDRYPDHRGAHVQLLRRRGAQHGRTA